MLPPDCQDFRDHALEASVEDSPSAGHADACEACGTWLSRLRVTRGLLGSLERLVAPEELGTRVTEELRGFPLRFAIACESLETRPAPAELDRLVSERIEQQAQVSERASRDFGDDGFPEHELSSAGAAGELDDVLASRDEAPDSLALRALRSVQPVGAPDVLDRLVAEELAGGATADVKRSVTELERLRAPSGLNRRVLGPLIEGGRPSRRGLAALATAAAAGILWFAGASNGWFGSGGPTEGQDMDPVAQVDAPELVVPDRLAGFAERLAARKLVVRGDAEAARSFQRVESIEEVGASAELTAMAGFASPRTNAPNLPLSPRVPRDLLAPRGAESGQEDS